MNHLQNKHRLKSFVPEAPVRRWHAFHCPLRCVRESTGNWRPRALENHLRLLPLLVACEPALPVRKPLRSPYLLTARRTLALNCRTGGHAPRTAHSAHALSKPMLPAFTLVRIQEWLRSRTA